MPQAKGARILIFCDAIAPNSPKSKGGGHGYKKKRRFFLFCNNLSSYFAVCSRGLADRSNTHF